MTIRKLDSLGRIVIPIDARVMLDIETKQSLEIFTENDAIVLKKYAPSCCICDNKNDLVEYRKKCICKACIDSL